MNKPKVFLTGGDGHGWAVDEDLKLTHAALQTVVELTDLNRAEIVHAVWWYGLLAHTPEELGGKRIICHVPGEPFRYFAEPDHKKAVDLVGRWITRTNQAERELRDIGIYSDVVPYLIDTDIFRPIDPHSQELAAFRSKWEIPEDVYLIGSFQRDTEGSDLSSPKLVKGPDVLIEILLELKRRGLKFLVVLAGPRRHWIIRRLEENHINFRYLGVQTHEDDLGANSLNREDLNLLYNLIDLYIVASRSEGGPHAILEAAASQCKIISTRVGIAPELLETRAMFRLPSEAADIIQSDITNRDLETTISPLYEKVKTNHIPQAVIPQFAQIYSEPDKILVYAGKPCAPRVPPKVRSKPADAPLRVCLWHSFFKPPYGGGNQFMMALRKGMMKKGVEVVENELDDSIDAYVLNSIHFDVDAFLDFSRSRRVNVVHRIDGPISLIRGYDLEKDRLCYSLNEQFASATVLQSGWVYKKIIELGYNPISPTIIHNGVDFDIFNQIGRTPFDRTGKIKLISSSWSNNPRKGGPIYKWIEDNLDWDRFEYTFVGNASEKFEKINHIPAVPSEDLADLLRSHDIYITASSNDPCSNALIEALACGLPALYLNDGGHPELVSLGGLPFTTQAEIPGQLDRLVSNYETVQRLITVNRMTDVTTKYLKIIREITK